VAGKEVLSFQLVTAALFMGAGVWLHLTEHHEHEHSHEEMAHAHLHVHDEHHQPDLHHTHHH
jgi:hypothetical protein